VRISYGASSALARQIEAGAPAQLFICADSDWMDYVEARGRIERGTRIGLLGNSLVLIAPAASAATLRIAPGFALAEALRGGRLAIADPSSVPAGKYARASLERLGVWKSVQAHLAPAQNVRVALEFVARGEAPLGIVYRTDALADPAVRIVDEFPSDTHAPIELRAFLASPAARGIWTRHGFRAP
jgi:molybdate transport system substrate-binding protein